MVRDGGLVCAAKSRDTAVPRELPCSCKSPLSTRESEWRIREHAVNRIRECIHVIRIDKDSGVSKNLRKRASTRGDDRHARGHRFQDRDPEPFVARWHDKEAGARIHFLAVWHVADMTNVPGERPL